MKCHWFLPSVLGACGVLCLISPAEAARLQSWQFNANQNQLVFSTDEGIQPRVQLVPNPTRLVVDLPGTSLGQRRGSQQIGGAIREVRVAQFDAQTTRIVVEFAEGYTIDPLEVRVRGASPTQWSIQLPEAQAIESSTPPVATTPTTPTTPTAPALQAATQIEEIRITPDGFFIRTQGTVPDVEQDRDDDRLTLEFEDTAISPQLTQRQIQVDRFGVEQIQLNQTDDDPPTVEIVLELEEDSPDWRTTASSLGGVVLIPGGAVASRPDNPRSESLTAPTTPADQPPTVQAIQISEDGSQLIFQANRALENITSGWDRASNSYQIRIPNAQLAPGVVPPALGTRSPFLRFQLRQETDGIVVQLLPAAGVRVGEIRSGNQGLAVAIQGGSRQLPTAPIGQVPTTPRPDAPLPDVSDSRVSVVIDPGHGGRDPGAVGINGLRETDIVLPIALEVAQILEEQGVQAILTRTDDREIDLEPRVSQANRANADLFVSIHANAISLSRPDINGTETYYYSDTGRALAQVIQSSVIDATGMRNIGVKSARFYVLRRTSMPAALVEVGFVTGGDDAPRLADPEFRKLMAEGIARGILQYVQQNF